MYDLYDELERSCERTTKELRDLNKKLANDESSITKEDIDTMDKLTHTLASVKKVMMLLDQYDSGSSGSNYNQSTWNRRYTTSSMRRGSSRNRGYSRDNDLMQRLNEMYQNARDDQEADAIQNIMNELSNR